jgi:hypothetical protein
MKNLRAVSKQKKPEALVEKNVSIVPQAKVNKHNVQATFSNNKKGNTGNRIIDTSIFQPTGILHQCYLICISFQVSFLV